ncbi:MAG: ATP-binding cassette domain-containing protein, partial [Cyclobacteriaceae bacterium]
MSEVVLNAILKLFAVVARQDEVTRQEREQIRLFLAEHVSHTRLEAYLSRFDDYSREIGTHDNSKDIQTIQKICSDLNLEITQKQKVIITLELIRIVLADEMITTREKELLRTIGSEFKISDTDVQATLLFVLGKEASLLHNQSILIISNSVETDGENKRILRKHLNGFIAVLYFRHVELYFVKYVGNSDVYLNGVPLKPGSISVLAVGSSLRWEKDDPVYYGEILNAFKKFSDGSRISFEAKNISFKFKNGKLGLRQINLAEQSGNLVALMGASGAGKSTLLYVLNGTETPSEGQVLINGIDIHKEPSKIEGVIGFVPQDDLLIEDLTVYENLYFAAKLCFSDKEEESIQFLVMKTLEDLGLAEIKDLKVGSPLRKTISGGQRKRLNIGLELLREPAVLFCDEPTSGLSSRDSENIIDLLKELSLKGKLVFAVIHQPSSDIFKKFDRLLILDTGGYAIYYGNPVDAIVYFKKCIDLVSSDEGECYACGNVNPEQIFNIIETKIINEYGQFTNERKISPEQWNRMYKISSKPPVIE